MVDTIATLELTRLGRVIDYCLDHLPKSMRPATGGGQILVVEGDPGDASSRRELIVVGNADMEARWVIGGASATAGPRRDETVTVNLLVMVAGEGRTQDATWIRRRCNEIGNDLAGVFRTKPHLSLDGLGSRSELTAVRYRPGPRPSNGRPREGTLVCELKVFNVRF